MVEAICIIAVLIIVGLAVFFVWRELKKRPKGEKSSTKEKKENTSRGVLKNKKSIESMVANVESILIYANGNDDLCHRLVEVKDNIRFFNPTTNDRVLIVDTKIANKLDDLKILVAKDNTQETCFRVLEEVEAYIVQRKKEEQA